MNRVINRRPSRGPITQDEIDAVSVLVGKLALYKIAELLGCSVARVHAAKMLGPAQGMVLERGLRKDRDVRKPRSADDMTRLRSIEAGLLANGRCSVCELMNPCGSTHSVMELAGNRYSITMPSSGAED